MWLIMETSFLVQYSMDSFICFYASNLAAATGMNPYKPPHEVLEDMWSRIDPAGYKAALARNDKKSKEETIQAILESNPGVSACVERAQSTACEDSSQTLTVATTAHKALDKAEIPAEHKELIKKHVQSNVFTKYGTDKEDRVFQTLLEQHGMKIAKDARFRKKQMGVIKGKPWYIGGKVDAVTSDRSRVVEIKNRVRRLFGRVVDYEHVQLQAYMQLLDIPDSSLVECFTGKDGALDMNVFHVQRDDSFWASKVMTRLTKFAGLLIDLLDNHAIQDGYLGCNREGFMKKFLSC